MSKTIAIKAAYRDRSTQVGNSVQLSAGFSFPDLKQSTGGRNSPRIKLMACGGLLQTTALPYEASHQSNAAHRIRLLIVVMVPRTHHPLWRDSQQPNAVRRGKLRINCWSVIATRQPLETRRRTELSEYYPTATGHF